MSSAPSTTEPKQLVEHFFRHESANLVAVLTRAFGFHRIDLVEDKVQDAMLTAVSAWRRGIPTNPAGWIHRVARNRILDALRREKVHERATSHLPQAEAVAAAQVEFWLEEGQLPDSLLRMMFVCCHPAIDRRSQAAMTLKILCGFGIGEIARGLLMSRAAAKKRIQRAKASLAARQVRLELPSAKEQRHRLAAIHDVLYLMFNEGYSTSRGLEPLRDDICEEAARLCHLLCESEAFSTPSTRALLALMLFHSSRLGSRVDADGAVVLLEDQDRARWDRRLIHSAEGWFRRSKTEAPSRFHFEAAIASIHCHAASVEDTDWSKIVAIYDRLLELHRSPLYLLNRAIAIGQAGDAATALAEIEALRTEREMRGYYLLDCAAARLHELSGDTPAAIDCYRAALATGVAPHEESLLAKKLRQLAAQ